MYIPFKPARICIVLMALLFACRSNAVFARSGAGVVRREPGQLVTLTVTSSCGSASIKVKKNVLTTPFTVAFPLGKTIRLKALDASVPQCGGLTIVSPFNQFIVNQMPTAKGQRSITLTLDQDTAVLVQYGTVVSTSFTLSVSANCPTGANILVTETTIGGQSGALRTHFDAHFLPGQSLRLEAPLSLPSCSELGVVLFFRNWSAGGKAYPQNQTAIDLAPTEFTSAYAHYGGPFPTLRINSYQLLHNGIQRSYVRVGEDFNEFTFLLTGEPFPPEINVFVIIDQAEQAEILSRASPAEIETRLPPHRADAPGFKLVRVTSSDSRFSNAVPIEIRRE